MIKGKNKIFRILAIALCSVCMGVCAACGDDSSSGGNNGGAQSSVRETTVSGKVRTASFAPIKADIFCDGKNVGVSGEDGTFEVTVPQRAGGDYASVINAGNSLTRSYFENGGQALEIIVLEEGMTVNDFYMFSGKVVLHSDGETIASGAQMKIDGNVVRTFIDNKNFDVGPVHKDSVITWHHEDGGFLDGTNFLPLQPTCFADTLASVTETSEQYFNGQATSLKHIVAYTVRLNDVE